MALAERTGAITEVRGAGLMVAVELASPTPPRSRPLPSSAGSSSTPSGTSILRFLPPLVCGQSEIDTLLETLLGPADGEVA